MSERGERNIDNFFKEGLENFNITPNNKFWENLKDDLQKEFLNKTTDDKNIVDGFFKKGLDNFTEIPDTFIWEKLKVDIDKENFNKNVESEKDLDNSFKEGLTGFELNPSTQFWASLKNDIDIEARHHEVDDLFHDHLREYGPQPPSYLWPTLRSEISNEPEYVLNDQLRNFESTPPEWMWNSLKFFLNIEKQKKQAQRGFVFLGLFIGLLIVSYNQFSGNKERVLAEKGLKQGSNKGTKELEQPMKGQIVFGSENSPEVPSLFFKEHKSQPETLLAINADEDPIKGQDNLLNQESINQSQNFEKDGFLAENKEMQKEEAALFQNANKVTPAISTSQLKPEIRKITNPKKGTRLSPISVSLLASKDISFRKLKGGEDNSEYMNIRNSSEKAIQTFSYALRLNYHYKRFKFSTGLNYTERGEKAEYNFKTQTEAQTNVQFYNQVSHTYFAVPYKYMLTYDHQKTTTNKYQYLEVPLRASYILNKNKLTVAPAVSMQIGYMVNASGTIVTFSKDPSQLELSNVKSSQMKKGLISVGTSVELQYKLNRRLSIVAEPFYNQSLTNNIGNSFSVKQKYYTKGVLFGIDYRF
ncbi:MAG: hypothetical protein HYZ42_13750 [Bacteroidetes bacterium]|nr:hypothetical protein [Bacteroidota bacterium]